MTDRLYRILHAQIEACLENFSYVRMHSDLGWKEEVLASSGSLLDIGKSPLLLAG